MKTVLLTSFGPYGRFRGNSSELASKALMKHLDGIWVLTESYPADVSPRYDRGKNVLDLALHSGADAIVSLGMEPARPAVSIEARAMNMVFDLDHCPGELMNTPVDPSFPYGTSLDTGFDDWEIDRFIDATVAAGLPRPEWSVDAGCFICNHLMFQIIRARKRDPERYGRIPWVFLRVPCTPEALPAYADDPASAKYVPVPLDIIVRCLEIFLTTALPADEEAALASA